MNIKHKYDETKLRELVKKSTNMANLLFLYNITPAGGNYHTMYRQLRHFKIDTSHWGTVKQRMGWLKGKTHDWGTGASLAEIMVKDTEWGGGSDRLKKRLIREKIFEKKCYNCNLTEWLNNPIPIELEHINGDKFDCRKENLTILCPNCHALTPTYRRRKNSLKIGSSEKN